MSKKIFSADSKGNGYVSSYVGGIFFCLFIVTIPYGVILLPDAKKSKQCRLDIYDDHIEGVSYEGIQMYFKNDQIEAVGNESKTLKIVVASKEYTLRLRRDKVLEATRILNKIIAER